MLGGLTSPSLVFLPSYSHPQMAIVPLRPLAAVSSVPARNPGILPVTSS